MKKNGRFMVGLVGVAAVVTYLIWTGVSETMVYYLTPVELMERVEADPTFHQVGVKVSGQVDSRARTCAPRTRVSCFHVFEVQRSGRRVRHVLGRVPGCASRHLSRTTSRWCWKGVLREDGVFEANDAPHQVR